MTNPHRSDDDQHEEGDVPSEESTTTEEDSEEDEDERSKQKKQIRNSRQEQKTDQPSDAEEEADQMNTDPQHHQHRSSGEEDDEALVNYPGAEQEGEERPADDDGDFLDDKPPQVNSPTTTSNYIYKQQMQHRNSMMTPPFIGQGDEADDDATLSPPQPPSPPLTAPLSISLDADADMITGDSTSPPPSSTTASSLSSSPALISADSPQVASIDIVVPLRQLLNQHRNHESFHLSIPFTLINHKWRCQIYPQRAFGQFCGAYLEYIGPADPASYYPLTSPSVEFRFVAFHRDCLVAGAPFPSELTAAYTSSKEFNVVRSHLALSSGHPKNAYHSEYHRFQRGGDYGWERFIRWQAIDPYLHGPNGSLHLRIAIEVERIAPKGTRPLKSFISAQAATTSKQWPFNGLNNQGATCYMNSYLQTLFYLPLVRGAVYNIPINSNQIGQLTETNRSTSPLAQQHQAGESKSDTTVAAALQMLLYRMQTAHTAVGTRDLTRSFGWDSSDVFAQHDVQEFSRKLLENLEDASKQQNPPLPPVTRYFEGRQESFIQCSHVPFKSSRIEPFLDLSLNVLGHKSLIESFHDYVAPETMSGANQYRAKDEKVDHGLQDATKGIRILKFPSILQLQLKRFQYDPQLDRLRKVDDAFAFQEKIDLRQFEHAEADDDNEERKSSIDDSAAATSSASSAADPAIYYLHSILVHRGRLDSGHYYAFIKPFLASVPYEHSPWFKFDDETVSICATPKEAIDKNFGGSYTEVTQSFGRERLTQQPCEGSAYMLIYVRESVVRARGLEVLGSIIPPQIPALPTDDDDVPMQAPILPLASHVISSPPPASLNNHNAATSSSPTLPHNLTDSPDDIDEFITALAPVDVPLPRHIEESLAQAQRQKALDAEEAARKAREYKIRIIAETDLIFHGLHEMNHLKGRAGVAGHELLVAPGVGSDSTEVPFSQFVFQRPMHDFIFERTDTLGSIREQMASRFGINVDRQQYWRANPKTKRPTHYIPNLNATTLEQIGFDQMGVESPILFLRDSVAIDHHPILSRMTANAGHLPVPAPSLHRPHAMQLEDRLLLHIKFFDVHSQRLLYISSCIIYLSMSMNELKGFLVALFKTVGIDLVQRHAVMDELVQRLVPASVKPDAASVLPASFPPPPTFLTRVDDPDVEIVDSSKLLIPSQEEIDRCRYLETEEDRWKYYQTMKDASHTTSHEQNGVDSMSDGHLFTPAPYCPFALPLRLTAESSGQSHLHASVASSTLTSVSPSTNPYVGMLRKLTGSCPSLSSAPVGTDLALAQYTSVRDAHWGQGEILILSEMLTGEMTRVVQTQQQQAGRTPHHSIEGSEELTKIDTVAKKNHHNNLTDSSSSSSSSSPLDLFPRYLTPLPRTTVYHLHPNSLLQTLHDRILVEFHPLGFDHATMETVPLDATRFPHHPLLGISSIVMEVTPTWSIQHVVSMLARAVNSQAHAKISQIYPQLADITHYKMWRSLPNVTPAQPNIGLGDMNCIEKLDTELTIRHALSSNNNQTLSLEHLYVQRDRRSTPFQLFYEVTPVSLKVLRTNWWLTLEYLDERGIAHRVPSKYPGLCPYEPFLVSKDAKIDFNAINAQIVREWILPHRRQLHLHQYDLTISGVALAAGIDEGAAEAPEVKPHNQASDVDGDEAMTSDSKKRIHREAKEDVSDDDSSTHASKKQRLDTNSSAVTSSHEVLDSNALLHAIYSPQPLVNPGPQWLLFPYSQAGPMTLYFQRYSPTYAFNNIAKSHIQHYMRGFSLQSGHQISTTVTTNDQLAPPLFPLAFTKYETPASTYYPKPQPFPQAAFTQPLPLPFTLYHAPVSNGCHAWIYRFTTIVPLPQKSAYAFSPQPPIYIHLTKSDTLTSLLNRLSQQLQRPLSSLHLAKLTPRQYELVPRDTDSPAALSFFQTILNDLFTNGFNMVLGLFDEETKHVRSTSQSHIESRYDDKTKKQNGAFSFKK